MRKIQIIPEKDYLKAIDIMIQAYPIMWANTDDNKNKLLERLKLRFQDPRVSFHGCYENRTLKGVIILYDYMMNLHGQDVLVGGGGALAVGLLYKKEHVAKDIITYFIKYYQSKKSPMIILWPFRPDFYRKMGAGMGSPIYQYTLNPADFKSGKGRKNVRFLEEKDLDKLNDCYNRVVSNTHGMVYETEIGRKNLYNGRKSYHHIGFFSKGQIKGYMVINFTKPEAETFIDYKIDINQFIYETPEALAALLSFLHTQYDQVSKVVYRTPDEYFYHAVKDPRTGSGNVMPSVNHESFIGGLGIMYRVIDSTRLFELLNGHDFNKVTVKLKLTVKDSFYRKNNGSYVIHFNKGKATVQTTKARFDVEMKIDNADFSSLIMGAVDLRSLNNYGQVKLSDDSYLEKLDILFRTKTKPICLTDF